MTSAILATTTGPEIGSFMCRLLALLTLINVFFFSSIGFADRCEARLMRTSDSFFTSENYSRSLSASEVPAEVIQKYRTGLIELEEAARIGGYSKKLNGELLDKLEEFLTEAKIKFKRWVEPRYGFEAISLDLSTRNLQRMGWTLDRNVVRTLIYCPKCLWDPSGSRILGRADNEIRGIFLDLETILTLQPSPAANHEVRHLELGALHDDGNEFALDVDFLELKPGSLRSGSDHLYNNGIRAEELFTYGTQFKDLLNSFGKKARRQFTGAHKNKMQNMAADTIKVMNQLIWLNEKFIPEIEAQKPWKLRRETVIRNGKKKIEAVVTLKKDGVELQIFLNSQELKLFNGGSAAEFQKRMLAKINHIHSYAKILAQDALNVHAAAGIDDILTSARHLPPAVRQAYRHAFAALGPEH